MAGSPIACSGARYPGVPTSWPVLVTGAESAARAMPKSVIFTTPPGASSRLPGLMSRCTSPARCAACRPDAVWAMMSRLRAGSSGPAASTPGQRRPSHEFHHQVRRLRGIRLAVVVDPGDVLVRQPPGVLRLRTEPGKCLGVLRIAEMQQLDRHRAGQDDVGGAPDLAEAARADLLPQLIPAAEHNTAGRTHGPAATRKRCR